MKQGGDQIDKVYFCRTNVGRPVFSDIEVERQYAVSKKIYEKLCVGVWSIGTTFHQRSDATSLLGASIEQQLSAALRMLCKGSSADAIVEHTRTSESSNLFWMKRFTEYVVKVYQDEWLRYLDSSEVLKI